MNNEQKKPFQVGLWYLNNKNLLKKITKYASIGIVILIWVILFINFTIYVINIKKTNNIIADLSTNYVDYNSVTKPNSVQIIESSAINSGNGKFDLFSRIKNPNDYWAVTITYQFAITGESITSHTEYLSPGQEIFLTELDVPLSSATSNTNLQILETDWQLVKTEVPKINFVYSNQQYTAAEVEDDETSYTRLTALANNKSIYGFRNLKITALLTSQGKPVAIDTTYINTFLSGQEKQIEFTWPKKIPFNSEIEFNVSTDVLDANNLILVAD